MADRERDDALEVDETGRTRLPLTALFSDDQIAERYASVNLHNDSPFKLRQFAGERETVVARDDELGRNYLARNICNVILRTQAPLTVAVYGRWGEGKTNIIKHVEEMLAEESGVRTVWFNLWEHQADINPVIAMLEAARTAAGSGAWRGMDAAARTLAGASIDELIRSLAWTAVDVAMPTVAGTVRKYRGHKAEVMAQRMSIQDEQTALRRKFHAALDRLAGESRVVFFIDDLDRCLPKQLVGLLERIRLFMDHDKTVFVFGADARAVARAIKENKRFLSEEWADHYLEKMVQVAFEIPPIDSRHKQRFVLRLLGNVSDAEVGMLGEERTKQIAEIMETAFDEQDATVRLIIRTANAFAMDHVIGRGFERDRGSGMWRPRIRGYDPRVMAVLTTIKTCYPEAYEGLRKRHRDRGELLELLFRQPESPDGYSGGVVPAWVAEECELAEELLGFFEGKDGYLTYVRGFVSHELKQELGESGARELLSGVSLNSYFELGGSSVAAAAPAAGRREVAPGSGEGAGGVPGSGEGAGGVPGSGEGAGGVRGNQSWSPAISAPPVGELAALRKELRRIAEAAAAAAVAASTIAASESVPVTGGAVRLKHTLAGRRWNLLALEDGRALLLSEQVLAERAYHSKNVRVTWEVCDLRRYLNGEFFKALPADVQEAVVVTEVANPDNPVWATPGGNPTRDRVFLLNLQEVMAYLCPDVAVGDEFWAGLQSEFFVDGRLAAVDDHGRGAWWWLRSPGVVSSFAANAYPDGALSGNGRHGGVSAVGGVRPAFWLGLEG